MQCSLQFLFRGLTLLELLDRCRHGHGGNDPGAQVGSALEKEIVMSIARKIQVLNTNTNIEIILSRDQDQFKSLSERTQFINSLNPDLVISLHAGISNNPQLSR